MAAPHIPANLRVWATLETGRMPGTISASIPIAAAWSRKRKKQSGEKKNWVIARSAPASNLRQRLSRSAALLRDSGRSEEHTSELQSLMRNSYAVFFLKN